MYNDGRVFFGSGVVALAFVRAALLLTGPVGRTFAAVQDWIVTQFAWFLILAVSAFLSFALWRLVSRHGAVRLGGDDEPEFSYPTWFSMLFSAGTGIGLLFCGHPVFVGSGRRRRARSRA